ncbi:MAG: hypothetical protein PHG20_13210, partial [Geobacteraceae bacterium]|nr:hypothetical protein [Geobacteraceae bacterium]
ADEARHPVDMKTAVGVIRSEYGCLQPPYLCKTVTIQHIEFSVIPEGVIGNPEGFSFESHGCPTNALGHDRRLVDSLLC